MDPQWIYVDLGKRDSICYVTLKWEYGLAQDYQIQVSDDASVWTIVSTVMGNTVLLNTIDVKTAGRYVRMYDTKRGSPYGYSLYEFQVYGRAIQSCATPTGVTSAPGAVSQSRKTVKGKTTVSTTSGIKAPYYVRIVKSGIKYISYISANGTT